MPRNVSKKPPYDDYLDWYGKLFEDDLNDGRAERWYEIVTEAAARRLDESDFWRELHERLPEWDAAFQADNGGYSLAEPLMQPKQISTKSFQSVLNKSYRQNVLNNREWPNPPKRPQNIEPDYEEDASDDIALWFGPHNWLPEFPDIFRTRLTATYFDGVRYLAEKVKELALLTTPQSPKLSFRASHDGYHAAHLIVFHKLGTLDYENRDPISVFVQLEIQVTTTIQSTITNMLHRIYEDWRITGIPSDWEWDHRGSAFAVNYLGSTLHYLEGMIVMAREHGRS